VASASSTAAWVPELKPQKVKLGQ